MRTLATKQPINDFAKPKNGDRGRGRGRSISPLSTGMPLFQRKCACGGGCPRCKEKLGIQTKLKISEPEDKYEQEADRIADEVMRMPEPSFQRQVEGEEEEEMVQRKVGDLVSPLDSKPEFFEVPQIVREVLNSPGQPLDPETRAFMESRFENDFGHVRAHTDSKASESARSINALAYTVGQNIVFDSNQYSPSTTAGKRLLAHELAHVVQQRFTKQEISQLSLDEPTSALEQEAHRASDAVLAGESVHLTSNGTSSLIQRYFLSAEPAGGCGICYGQPNLVGRAAHQLIQTEFEVLYPLGLVELLITSPLDDNARLDLAIATPTGLEIGEIKPANERGYSDGITQIATYVAMLSALFPRSTIRPLTRLIPPIIFPTLSPTCPTQTLYVNPPVGGVYGYYCQPSFAQMRRNCPCNFDRSPVRERAPARERTRQETRQLSRTEAISLILAFVRRIIETNVADIDRAVTNFVHENPAIAAFIITAGVAAIIAMVADDLTLVGIADDVAIPPIIVALWRVAIAL